MAAKTAAPAPLDLPPELAGWRWHVTMVRGSTFGALEPMYQLEEIMTPGKARGYGTKGYARPDKAIAEAKRYVLSQPKPKKEAAMTTPHLSIEAATETLGRYGYTVKKHGARWLAAFGAESPKVLATDELITLAAEHAAADTPRRPAAAEPAAPPPDTLPLGELLGALDAHARALPRPLPTTHSIPLPAGIPARFAAPLDLITPGRYQPRTQFDAAELDELAASIAEHGILNPLLVFASEAGKLELVAGERRLRAARQIGLAFVPVDVRSYTLRQVAEISGLDNIQRANLSAAEEGAYYNRLMAELGISENELSKRLGKNRAYIQQRRAIASAAPEVLAALASSELTFSQARAIAQAAPGQTKAQSQALTKVRELVKNGKRVTETDAKNAAEKIVLSKAKKDLEALGWQVAEPYGGFTIWAPSEKPRQWTGAEIIEAVATQRRPSSELPPAAADAATPADAGRDGPGDRDGGADGAGDRGDDPVQLPDPDARIVTARADLTATADPRLVPEECRRHLSRHGIEGAALAIAALEKHGGFLLADGTGAGKTRQILSVSKHFAGRGKKVLIVTKNQIIKPDWEAGTVDGSFRDDGELLGVRPLANQGDRPLAPGQVHITTYERLGDAAHLADKDTVVIFDESHALKNASSQVARHGFGMADKAFAVLYSSATPEDKPMHIAHLFRARVFGDKDPAETYSRLGLLQRGGEPGPDGQLTPATWVVDPRVGAAEVYRRLDGLFRQLTREGLMVKRELGMKGVDVGFRRIELPPEADEVAGKIAAALANAPDDLGPRVARLRRDLNALRDQLKAAPDDQALRSRVHAAADELATEQDKLTRGAEGIGKATLLMHLRRQQEPFKVPHAVAAAKAELDEGRQVVIFCSRINTSKVRKKVVTGYDVDDDGRTRPVYGYEDVHESEGTAKLLKEALAAEGVTDVAELHGNAEDESPEAMKRFQTGRARVVIATMESGGTGINLDDVTGSRPRTMLVLTAPFSAVENVQAAGRVWRMSTKSAPRVRYLFSDSAVDRWNAAIIATKMDSLGAGVSGEVDRLKVPVGELQGAEALEMARAAENEPPHPLGPFEWGALTGTVDTPPAEDVGFNYYRVDPRGYYEIAFDKGAYEQLPLSTRGTIHWLFKFDRRRGAWVSKAPAVAMTADQLKAAARVAAAAGLKPRGGASFDPPATRPPVAPPPVPPPTPTPTPPPAGQSPAATPGDALIERVDRREAEFAGRVQKYRPAVVADGGRVSVTFATRPTPDVRESLKARGFRFDGSGWSARLTPEVRSWVERFTGAALPPPAAAPAPPPPRPPDPAKGPPPVNARRVPTARGERLAHDFTPSEGLWRAREDGLLPSSVSVYRDTRTGRWQARVYGQTEADIGRDLQRLAELGAYQCSRFRRACLRQAAAARGRGDVASARIYLRQAAVASRR